jgi:D-alanyl-D-alanine carboxypeptidase (penicillin-binding protein 5/6)
VNKFIATLILTLSHLGNIHLGPVTNQQLQSHMITARSNHSLSQISGHTATLQPVQIGSAPLSLQASSVIAQDVSSNAVLYQKNDAAKVPIASITKLATVLVILQHHKLSDLVTIPALPAYDPEDDILGLTAGEQFRVSDLVQAALVASANDSADSLALIDSGTEAAFSAKMNRLVATWGLDHTRYNNPTGLNDDGNYSTAADLAKLAKLALTNPDISRIINEPSATITDSSGRSFDLKSTNDLLTSDPRFHGIKTGYTVAAGQSFMGLATIHGHQVITVVLHSPDRFGETTALANWVEKEFQWQ